MSIGADRARLLKDPRQTNWRASCQSLRREPAICSGAIYRTCRGSIHLSALVRQFFKEEIFKVGGLRLLIPPLLKGD